jgi:hypothetical protein
MTLALSINLGPSLSLLSRLHLSIIPFLPWYLSVSRGRYLTLALALSLGLDLGLAGILGQLRLSPQRQIIPILHRDALSHVVDFIDAHKPLGEFKHVVPQTDDDELGVFGAFFDIPCYN